MKLTNHYVKQLLFVQLGGTVFQSSVVYASSIGVENLAQKLFKLSSTEKISDVALQLYENIMRKFKETGAAIWPPTARGTTV